MYSFGYFAIHSVFPIWPSSTERSVVNALILTIEITPLKQNVGGLSDRTGPTDESAQSLCRRILDAFWKSGVRL